MPITYDFPTDADLMLIDKDYLDDIEQTDPIFDEFPMRNVDDNLLVWEQKDNTTGLTHVRGLNGSPPSVKRLGGKRFMMEPGVYGEFLPIDELELTRRRPMGMVNGRIPISDLVAECQTQLLTRQMNRARWVMWQLLINGQFNVFGADGSVIHRDSYKQTVAASAVPWSTYATATPLADFRAVQLLHRGHSVSFGASAKAYMSQQTLNWMLSNGNSVDVYGRRTQGLGTYNSLDQLNALYAGDGLPQVVLYDDGYLSDGTDGNPVGSFQLFIPDGYVVVLGKRSNGAKIGEFRMTRNINRPDGGPGAYSKVIDFGDRQVPRKIEVHRGFNGGPILAYPSSIVVMKVI